MNTLFELSDRVKQLPPYIFAEIDKIKQEALNQHRPLTLLGIGDPDLPTPRFILDQLALSADQPANQKYPSYEGKYELRKAISDWYQRRFGINPDPKKEVLTLIGSKEGIAHLPLAFMNPGEAALIPDPAYPVYHSATLFAGGIPLPFSLKKENGFLPDFAELEHLVKKGPKVRILFLNYPNNPTAAVADLAFFQEVVVFAKKHQLIVCHDNAYSEIYFDGKKPPSFLQAEGAMEVGCEFHSLSKTFNMTGFRVGFVIGNPKLIAGLSQVKTNIDSGVFNACQDAAIAALTNDSPFCDQLRDIYQKRRDVLVPALQGIELECVSPEATFYVWARLPKGSQKVCYQSGTSTGFVMDLIRTHGIVSTPGNGFGKKGEGFVRFTLCSDILILKKVAETLKNFV